MARARSNAIINEENISGSNFDPILGGALGYDPYGSDSSSLYGGATGKRSRPTKRKYVQIPDASDRTHKKQQSPTASSPSSSMSPSDSSPTSDPEGNSKPSISSSTPSTVVKNKTLQPQKG